MRANEVNLKAEQAKFKNPPRNITFLNPSIGMILLARMEKKGKQIIKMMESILTCVEVIPKEACIWTVIGANDIHKIELNRRVKL